MDDSEKEQLNLGALTCLLEGCRQTSLTEVVSVSFNDRTQTVCF